MARLGAQPAHRVCGALLDELCRGSTHPCALLDPAGRIVSSSPLFASVADREPRLGALLAPAPARALGGDEVWLDDGWLVCRAALLGGTALTMVQLYGPAVVRARVDRIYGVSLSAREGECLSLALEGAENGDVAARLGVRPETVKVHLRNAYRKLDAAGRADILARLVAEA
jgi:DNA-binding CsgD family transcriptional regulator